MCPQETLGSDLETNGFCVLTIWVENGSQIYGPGRSFVDHLSILVPDLGLGIDVGGSEDEEE